MSMSNVWAVDFDSTLNNMNRHICRTLELLHNIKVRVEDIDHWHFWDDHEAGDIVWNDLYHSKEWTLSIPTKDYAYWCMSELAKRGDKVYIISDRFEKEYDVCRKWLDNNGFQHIPILLTDKKRDKNEIANVLGCTHVIDDSPNWIDRYTQSYSISKVYIMDYPYNQEVFPDYRLHRVKGWKEVMEAEGLFNGYGS